MKIHNVEVIESEDRIEFQEKVARALEYRSVVDIKFAVTPDVHSTGIGGSYSAGETYYAMIIFE